MSMIENQVSILKELAELQNISYHKSIINRAADTVEALSEELADKERQWRIAAGGFRVRRDCQRTALMCLYGLNISGMENMTDYFKQKVFLIHLMENGLDLLMEVAVGIN